MPEPLDREWQPGTSNRRLGRQARKLRLPDEARHMVIDGIDYAAYRETDSSLHDSDKNRLFGSEHYKSDRPVYHPSPCAEGDFEEKMATLLVCADVLNRSVPAFAEAERLLENEESVSGQVIRVPRIGRPIKVGPNLSLFHSIVG